MDRKQAIRLIQEFGDACVNYSAAQSHKLRYTVCTMDFNNKHILSKGQPKPKNDGTILVFAWDADSYKHLDPKNITTITPLSAELKNEPLDVR